MMVQVLAKVADTSTVAARELPSPLVIASRTSWLAGARARSSEEPLGRCWLQCQRSQGCTGLTTFDRKPTLSARVV